LEEFARYCAGLIVRKVFGMDVALLAVADEAVDHVLHHDHPPLTAAVGNIALPGRVVRHRLNTDVKSHFDTPVEVKSRALRSWVWKNSSTRTSAPKAWRRLGQRFNICYRENAVNYCDTLGGPEVNEEKEACGKADENKEKACQNTDGAGRNA